MMLKKKMQTQVIEKNNKQRCCEHVKRTVQASLFFRHAIKEVDFLESLSCCGRQYKFRRATIPAVRFTSCIQI